jgi:cobalt-zinc-cadmium efflux system outer membrane protein
MPLRKRATLVAIVMLSAFARGRARAEEPIEITLELALESARERSPEAGAARLGVEEALGGLEGASVLLRENPTLGVGLGPQLRGPSGVAAEAELSQSLELGSRRSARIDAARAGVDRAAATGEEVSRRAMREAGIAFYRVLHAQERVKLALRAEELADATRRISERRHEAGDVPVLHVAIARGALARARSERKALEATLAALQGELRILLGLDPKAAFRIKGDLSERSRFESTAASVGQPEERPDLRSLAADLRGAGADLRLGESLAWPNLGVGVKFTQEEVGSSAVLGMLSLTLPIFERGQGVRAQARARAQRLRFELDGGRQRVRIEADTALLVYRQRVEALSELEATARVQDQNESLARRSYEMGELGLSDLLLVRREVLETQVDFLGRQLDAAMAGIELEAATGAMK